MTETKLDSDALPATRPTVGDMSVGDMSVCDMSTTCLACGSAMRPEHAHYRCPACGWRDSCCDGPY